MSRDGSVNDPKYLAPDGWAAGKQKTQWIRKAQYPLAQRLFGKDLVHQQRSTLGFSILRRTISCVLQSSAMRLGRHDWRKNHGVCN
jgi:hypothetical protein